MSAGRPATNLLRPPASPRVQTLKAPKRTLTATSCAQQGDSLQQALPDKTGRPETWPRRRQKTRHTAQDKPRVGHQGGNESTPRQQTGSTQERGKGQQEDLRTCLSTPASQVRQQARSKGCNRALSRASEKIHTLAHNKQERRRETSKAGMPSMPPQRLWESDSTQTWQAGQVTKPQTSAHNNAASSIALLSQGTSRLNRSPGARSLVKKSTDKIMTPAPTRDHDSDDRPAQTSQSTGSAGSSRGGRGRRG